MLDAETIGRTLGRGLATIVLELPSLVRVYVALTAVLAHLGLLVYLVYINMTCTGWCLGAAIHTELAKYAILGLLLVSAVGLVLKRLLDAHYQSKHARDSDV
ncbi:hypothetical protein [Haloferax sp. Atlit-12N]|uniref:hypothetical protein n=1 Tax=Haloferax sp. Atlit-12N TaxID=2077203 RepID=UPI0011E5AADF|nr:hypothetical protein [Haloferax sp. Atlit-12N]